MMMVCLFFFRSAVKKFRGVSWGVKGIGSKKRLERLMELVMLVFLSEEL